MTTDRSITHFLLAFCAGVLSLHWLNQLAETYPLMFDEAQYWFWSKHPALGYYSKPPMIAWLMAASTAIFGDGAFGVRILAPVLQLSTGIILFLTARLLGHDRGTSAWVLVTYITLPVITGGSAFFSTDVPLIFFWSLGLYAGLRAMLYPSSQAYWLLAGLAAGLGMLSKYTMVGFGASVLLALLINPQRRKQLATPWPWLAGIIALAIFVPNLWWNAQHQFVTFNHTEQNVFTKQLELYPRDTIIFVVAQFGLFGPILMAALLQSLRRIRHDSTLCLLHCFVWPLAITGTIICFVAGAQAHWVAPIYVAATLIAVPWLRQHARMFWLQISLLLHLVLIAMFYAAPAILPKLPVDQHALQRLSVWNNLAAPVKEQIAKHPNALLMTEERKIAAALTYKLRGIRDTETIVYKWPHEQIHDHYDLVTRTVNLQGKPILLITRTSVPWQSQRRAKLLETLVIDDYRFELVYIPSFR